MRALGAIFVLLILAGGGLASERAGAGAAVGSVVAVIPLAAAPSAGLTASDTAVWVPSDPDGALAHLDPETNQVSATIHMGPTPTCSLCWGAVAADEGGVWTTSTSARLAVVQIDPVLNRVTTSLPLTVFPSAVVTASDGTLWLASVLDSAVVRFDLKDGQQVATLSVPRASRLAVGDAAVWVLSHSDGSAHGFVARIDPRTNDVVANVEVGSQPTALAFGEDSVWVVDQGNQRVQRIDPHSNTVVANIGVGFLPTGVIAGHGSVWVISQSAQGINGPALSRIDPISNTVTGSVALGQGSPVGLTLGAGSVWIANRDPDTIVRVDPFSPQPPAPLTLRHDSPPVFVLMAGVVLLLMAAWLRRPSLQATSYIGAHDGPRMSDLRRFIENRPRTQ